MADFTLESFTWDAGAFVVNGDWSPGAEGRPRLLAQVDGRTRNLGTQGGTPAGGSGWKGTFACTKPPDPGTGAILRLGTDEFPIGAANAEAPPPPPPPREPATAPPASTPSSPLPPRRVPRERVAPAPAATSVPEWFGYVVGAIIAVAFVLMLIWVL